MKNKSQHSVEKKTCETGRKPALSLQAWMPILKKQNGQVYVTGYGAQKSFE